MAAASIAAGDTSGGGGGTPLSDVRNGIGIVPAMCCAGEFGTADGARGPPGGGPGMLVRGSAPASGGGKPGDCGANRLGFDNDCVSGGGNDADDDETTCDIDMIGCGGTGGPSS